MHYSENPDMVRVDFFKPSGKWYATEAIKWTGGYNNPSIIDAFAKSLNDALGDRLSEMDAICLHPYHKYAHPIQMKGGSWRNL